MGMFPNRYSSDRVYYGNLSEGDPNPVNFIISYEEKIGNYWISEIVYPDCRNYEGRKILITKFKPSSKKEIDPHFAYNSGIIARFEPSKEGVQMAMDMLKGVI